MRYAAEAELDRVYRLQDHRVGEVELLEAAACMSQKREGICKPDLWFGACSPMRARLLVTFPIGQHLDLT